MIDRPNLKTLREIRSQNQGQLLKLPNVLGTALGIKYTDSSDSGQKGVTVFVKKKELNSKLKSGRIPKKLMFKKTEIATDVIEIDNFVSQFGPTPFFSFDGHSQGTVSSTFYSYGKYYGVTCAHCLAGLDLDPYTLSDMALYHSNTGQYLKIGQSAYAVMSPGRGITNNYGFSDAGLFTIDDPQIIDNSTNGSIKDCWEYPQIGANVYTNTSHGQLTGTISLLEAQYGSVYTDLIVSLDNDGTNGGDSGSLWRTRNELIVAMHSKGLGNNSKFSFCMSARRIVNELQGKFVEPVSTHQKN